MKYKFGNESDEEYAKRVELDTNQIKQDKEENKETDLLKSQEKEEEIVTDLIKRLEKQARTLDSLILSAKGFIENKKEALWEDEPQGSKVYFIQGNRNDPIKIGTANQVKERVKTLQRTCPVKLEVILSIDGGYSKEKKLHEQFKDINSHNEWFYPKPPLVQYILTELKQQRDRLNQLITEFEELL